MDSTRLYTKYFYTSTKLQFFLSSMKIQVLIEKFISVSLVPEIHFI